MARESARPPARNAATEGRRMAPAARGSGAGEYDVAPDGSGLTPRVRATRHVVWALLLGWLALVVVAVVLVTVL